MKEVGAIDRFYALVERWSARRAFPYLLALLLVPMSIFFATPCFTCYNPQAEAWEILDRKAADPTDSLEDLDPYTWLAKKVFRLTMPIVARYTGLPPIGFVALQYLLGYVLLVVAFKLAERTFRDGVAATFVAAGLAFTYYGWAGYYDVIFTWFDGVSFCLLALAMYSRRVVPIVLFSLAAAWNDERAFIALGIVLLYHQLCEWPDARLRLGQALRLNPRSLAVLGVMAAYLLTRWWLGRQYGMHTPSVGANLSLFEKTLWTMPVGVVTFLEGFWILVVLALVRTAKQRDLLMALVVLVPVLLFVVVAGSVTDTTRSGSFLMPMVFLLGHYLSLRLPKTALRRAVVLGFLFTFAFPMTIVCADWAVEFWFQWPAVVRMLL